jgi:hypothetical protein
MQENKQADPRALNGLATRFPFGVSGNPMGKGLAKKRREAMLAALSEEFPLDELPAADRELLKKLADALVSYPHREEEKTRSIYACDRILRRLRANAAKRRPSKPKLSLFDLHQRLGARS